MSKEIYISSTPHETRLAIVENDNLTEIYYERENEYTLAGSIYNGKVTRVLPGMQSSFVDIGLDRDAFLYITDFMEEAGDAADFEGAAAEPRRGGRDGAREQGRDGAIRTASREPRVNPSPGPPSPATPTCLPRPSRASTRPGPHPPNPPAANVATAVTATAIAVEDAIAAIAEASTPSQEIAGKANVPRPRSAQRLQPNVPPRSRTWSLPSIFRLSAVPKAYRSWAKAPPEPTEAVAGAVVVAAAEVARAKVLERPDNQESPGLTGARSRSRRQRISSPKAQLSPSRRKTP